MSERHIRFSANNMYAKLGIEKQLKVFSYLYIYNLSDYSEYNFNVERIAYIGGLSRAHVNNRIKKLIEFGFFYIDNDNYINKIMDLDDSCFTFVFSKKLIIEERNKEREKLMKHPKHKIKQSLRRRINEAVSKGLISNHTMDLLGCDIDFFKRYLEEKFKKRYGYEFNWDWYNRQEFHIDHIIPCNSFDLTKKEEQKKCFHYSNLQLLSAYENISKGGKIY